MTLIADILLVAGALGAGFYCWILSRRLNKFNDLEKGVGGAVAVLSMQVDDMTKSLENARTTAGDSTLSLRKLTKKADSAAKRLELLMATMHDLPTDSTEPKATKPDKAKPEVRDKPVTDPAPEMQFFRHQEQTMEAAQ